MAASVQDLLLAASQQLENRKSPLIGLLEGFQQSTLRGLQKAPERALAGAKFRALQAERKRVAGIQEADTARRQASRDAI